MVHLHDLLHTLQTTAGTRPAVVSGDRVCPVGVEVVVRTPWGEAVRVRADSWSFRKYRPATGKVPERPAALVLACEIAVPAGPQDDPAPPDRVPAQEPAFDGSTPLTSRTIRPGVEGTEGRGNDAGA
jgi:hypothetical protein